MLNSSNLFRLLNEFILLLLGGLLLLLSATGRIAFPAHPAALVALGIFFIYWGVRAWIRPEPRSLRLHKAVRAGSLFLVGLLVLGTQLLSTRFADIFLALAGAVLVVRGLLGGVLSLWQP